MKPRPSLRPQAGVALITALLVVAVAVLAATALLTASHLAVRRTAAMRDTEQAWWLARGVEAWIVEIIKQDDPDYDALDKNNAWSLPVDYLPVDQGFLRGRVVDQQGLFNLNNLQVKPTQPQDVDVYGDQFRRLVAQLAEKFDLKSPPDVVPAIRDWMDENQMPDSPGPGAEDMEYLALEPPYRAANRPFSSVSELRAVYGVTPELYRALVSGCPATDGEPPQPCISALPFGQAPTRAGPAQAPQSPATRINVNTASRPVLMALSATPDKTLLEAFLSERTEHPAKSRDAFAERNIYKDADPGERIDQQYDVRTDYFQIRGEVVVGSSRLPLYSLIRRQPAPVQVVSHSAAED